MKLDIILLRTNIYRLYLNMVCFSKKYSFNKRKVYFNIKIKLYSVYPAINLILRFSDLIRS